MTLPRQIPFILLAGLVAASACGTPAPAPPRASSGRDIRLVPDTRTIEGRVPSRSTFSELFRSHQVRDGIIDPLITAAQTVFDVRKLRADQPYRLVQTLDGWIREFHYEIDADRFLRIVRREGAGPAAFEAAVLPFEKQRTEVVVRTSVDRERPSLIAALAAEGEGIELALDLVQIFGGEVDFNSDLQPGDTLRVLFDAEWREGRRTGHGEVFAAELVNGGRAFRAFRYAVPGQPADYYDEHGRSLKRFFLRSPLGFDPQVTSRFSRRRLHPVLGIHRAHLGVDYRAPHGAPVVAVAAGTVVSASYSGGSGRMVRLRHAGGYETYYLHLSAFAPGVRPGARVQQGELIGRVGSTGLATGPHLDYRVRKDGQFLDPLRVHRELPPGEPIPEAHQAAFQAARAGFDRRLLDPAAPGPDVTVAAD